MDNQTNFTFGQTPRKTSRSPRNNSKWILIGVLVLILLIVLAMFPPFVSIPAGHTGIVVTFGRVADYTLDSGFHLKNPVQQIVLMDNRTQKAVIPLQAFSSDIQQVDVVSSLNYRIDRTTAQTLYSSVGTEYYSQVMEPRIHECVKAVFTRYSAEKLMQVRDTLSTQVKELLEPEMKAYGIDIQSVSIENVDFTDAFTNAVEEKQVAEQTKLRVETEQAQQVSVEKATAERQIIAANAQAEEKKILAEAEADVAKVRAEASAYARDVEAEAEAEANRKLAESITDELIKYMEANRWNGALPQFMGADSVLPILDTRTEDVPIGTGD